MSTEANKAIIRRYREIHNSGNLAGLDEIVAPDLKAHSQLPGLPEGREGGKMAHQVFDTAFPHTKTTTNELVAEGDLVVERFTATGVHKGDFMGMPGTGKPFTVTGMSIFRIKDGKIVEHWGENDGVGLMMQIGMLPMPGGQA